MPKLTLSKELQGESMLQAVTRKALMALKTIVIPKPSIEKSKELKVVVGHLRPKADNVQAYEFKKSFELVAKPRVRSIEIEEDNFSGFIK